ncbi:hypothetical protein AGOR_G00105880 [Albula goreensis]|uniref:Uncharacterized protein n=1 Tax=Albula goreensis TaxID=1534307 RepID=A0A8T3DK47_9TELE|nr:hypothetical protein AGOR_G00105880 [Albula goreensis]
MAEETGPLSSIRAALAIDTSQYLRMAQAVLCSEKAGSARVKPTAQLLQEIAQTVRSIMGNALLGEPSSLENIHLACQAIIQGQEYCEDFQHEEWSPKNWLSQFIQQVEQAVRKKIPQPPLQRLGSGHWDMGLQQYLLQIQRIAREELQRLSQCLSEGPLLGHVVECFHLYIFTQLDQVLQCTLTPDEIFLLLQWVKCVYLSKELMSHPDIQDYFFKAIDILVLSDWLKTAEKKCLSAVQEVISERLWRILHSKEIYWSTCVQGDEEDFIKLHFDVIQMLEGCIQQASSISKLLKTRVQEICYQELLVFIENYVEREKKQLKVQAKSDGIYSFRTFSTCRELRNYVKRIASDSNDDLDKAVSSLKIIETQALELVLKKPVYRAEASFKTYFKKGDRHIVDVMEKIRVYFITLPNSQKQAHKKVVDTAYHRITSLYLKHLLRSNQHQLERRWDDVGKQVTEDANILHQMFFHLNSDVARRNQALLKVEEILGTNDVDAQKMTVAKLKMECPDVSQKQIRTLLCWKRMSRNQIREVLDASQDLWSSLDPFITTPRPWHLYYCCCCSTEPPT